LILLDAETSMTFFTFPLLRHSLQGEGDTEMAPSWGSKYAGGVVHGIDLITISGRKASVPEPDLRTGFLLASRTDTYQRPSLKLRLKL